MIYVLSYVFALLAFVAFDSAWLLSTGNTLYKPVLGDILVDDLRIAPTVLFYLSYPAAIVVFGVAPAIKADSIQPALIYGALFGLFAYATYDLTNFATLRNWTWQITVIDVIWGAFATGTAAAIAFYAARTAAGMLGLTER